MLGTNTLIDYMESKDETDNIDKILDYNFSVKPKGKEDTKDSGFDIEQEVSSCTSSGQYFKKVSKTQSKGQLYELELQVENAEVRCDTLKQQLEYMKMLYQDKLDHCHTELLKCNASTKDSKESLQNLESDTFCVNKDSVEILQVTEEDAHNMPDHTEAILLPEYGVEFLCPPTADGDFEGQHDNVYKEISSVMVDAKDIKNNCCTFANVNFYSQISPPENSFNIYATDAGVDLNQSVYNSNLLATKEMDHQEDSADNNNNKLSLNSHTDVINHVLEVDKKNGVINPVEAIQGILNGISDSVNIISHLGVHASNSGKKECTGKHCAPKKGTSCSTKKSTLHQSQHSIESLQLISEQQNLSDFSDNNVLMKSSYTESKHSTQKRNHHHHCHHHHHQHHHHHTCRQHHHSYHEDSLSFRNNVLSYDHLSVQTNPNFSEELISDSCHRTQKNKYKESRPKDRKLEKSLGIKSSQDVRKYISKSKSRKKSRVEKLTKADERKISQGQFGGNERPTNKFENILSYVMQEKKRQREGKKVRSQSPMRDTRENDMSSHSNGDSVVNACKELILKSNVNKEDTQKQNDVPSFHSTTNENKHMSVNNMKSGQLFDNSLIQGLNGKLKNEHGSSYSSHYDASQNYSLPTLSSRQKQVEKPLLDMFNFRNIPFVVGTSTTRSHNLALNLQQALSIIKLRSSSLGFGSGSATEVASSIFGPQSRSSQKIFCPVAVAQIKSSKSQMDTSEYPIYYDRCEKMSSYEGYSTTGKFDSLSKSEIEADNNQGLSFSQMMRKENIWEVDQVDQVENGSKSVNGRLRCTCFPTRPCVDYHKVLYDYVSNRDETQIVQMFLPSSDKKETISPQNPPGTKNGVSAMTQPQQKFHAVKDGEITSDIGESPMYAQIQAHSKELKEVLMNMHRDFIRLNEKYEHVHNQIENPDVDGKKATKELDILESELQAKENDLVIVLGLHKQLLSLKQQVKALRMKTNSQLVFEKPPITPNVLPRESTVSVRLTRLLHTIRRFQEKLLNE